MAEGKDYEAVLTEEDDQNKVTFEGAEEESKEATGRFPEEIRDLEVIKRILKHEREGDIGGQNSLIEIVEKESYDLVKERVTAMGLMNDGENTLLLAIKVSVKLRERATRDEADEDDFIALAEQVEEFTLRFLDPMKHANSCIHGVFCSDPELDVILEAIKLEQKKFFEHSVVDSILTERWYTPRGRFWKIYIPGLWLFLNIWCLVDVALFPLSFLTAPILGNANSIF